MVGREETGAPPGEAEQETRELVEEVRGYAGGAVLTLAAYCHCKLESIHPFADGNGRTGRALVNFILLSRGYPPAVFYCEDKPLYLRCLERFDRTGEIDVMTRFLEYQTAKTWAALLQGGGQNGKEDCV